jgi:diacylglycerol kinase
LVAIAGVFATEILNTCIENLADAITTDYHPLIKKAKDLAAAAVLVVSVGALVTGLVVFIPKLVAIAI